MNNHRKRKPSSEDRGYTMPPPPPRRRRRLSPQSAPPSRLPPSFPLPQSFPLQQPPPTHCNPPGMKRLVRGMDNMNEIVPPRHRLPPPIWSPKKRTTAAGEGPPGNAFNATSRVSFRLQPPSHTYSNVAPQPPPPRRREATSSSATASASISTSAISFHETNHGRQRRIQRAIPSREIQAAIKHGTRHDDLHNPNLIIYKHNGKKHVLTRDDVKLVTTMVDTVILKKKKLTKKDVKEHDRALALIHGTDDNLGGKTTRSNTLTGNATCKKEEDDDDDYNYEKDEDGADIKNAQECWKSHSVIIVDKSGSMRQSDVRGCRSRFGAVWLSLAQDYIEHRIKSGMAGLFDVISIILMGDDAEILVDRWPTNYTLYNKIVDFFHESEEADKLWQRMNSDHINSRAKHDNVQRRLNRLLRPKGHGCYRPALILAEDLLKKNDNDSSALTLLLLSDGRPSDYHVFKHSVEDGKNILKNTAGEMASRFGRRFSFSTIGMGSNNEFDTLQTLVDTARDFGGTGSFSVPSMSCSAIGRCISSVATSLTKTQTELTQRGKEHRRIRKCLRENTRLIPLLTEVVSADDFNIYMNNAVQHYEYRISENGGKEEFIASDLQHPDAVGVAMKKKALGEGAERFAFQFFEIAKDGFSVVGPPLVAKENRFIYDNVHKSNWKARDKFAKRFCKVQMAAGKAAKEFNKKLDSLDNLDPHVARANFLDCSIYYLTDPETDEEFSVVVEKKLDGKFQKWNNNNGWHIGKDKVGKLPNLAEDDDNENVNEKENVEELGTSLLPIEIDDGIFVNKEEVAQAFSHFSYIQSGKKMLICDLQGVFCRPSNTFNFTDPVIHYHDARKEGERNKRVYGKTDMGQKGIENFFKTHQCNKLCKLMTKGFINVS